MTQWVATTLAQCCEIISGATPQTAVAEYWDGDICWATPKDLSDLDGHFIASTPRKITKAGLSNCAASVLPANSVLFSSRAPIGHVAINTTPMATNQGFKSFIPKRGLLEPKFLFHWLRANRNYLESLGNGATFKEVSKAVVARVEIALPPVHEQRHIAAILDQADALRAKRREALAQLDSLTQSIFVEMFGDPASNPMHWDVVSLDSVASKITDGEHLTPRRTAAGIKLLSARNVRDGFLDFADVDYIDEVEFARISKRCNPEFGDILISCSGSIGRVAIVETTEPLALVRSAALVKPNVEKIDARFLETYLRSAHLKQLMLKSARSSSQANLFQGPIRSLPVCLPSFEHQEAFEERYGGVRRLRNAHVLALTELDALFASLQHRAFAGTL